ncbi:ATP-binding cassette domain-containing protein [Alteribacillus bidgolensis]|uniref:ABC-type dipeptide/oligopeptide/nickel transport system, ATPase component n=1 Tax=Alteribacillus bidgolensis TaxID=930129 RepID=A0A1G8EMY2_9BACI|nr:ABC transporter ATP-binding protein [Alteribacillus bidgolensis]SDH71236.1 ABC-type dipeptide/oligopeptide/nickel transport system, ATPase component [Alteribacillus bidgolensis]
MFHLHPLLQVDQLEISHYKDGEFQPLVRDVSFQIQAGEMVALTGPSGCGKSLTAQAIVGLLGKRLDVTGGKIMYQQQNVVPFNDRQWKRLRRHEIALLIQDSLNGLNPIRTIKKQMAETICQKRKWNRKDILLRLHTFLHEVGFSDPAHILRTYPFELSGGMRQRVLLAMMLSLEPKVIIADEPTTSLDIINREKVLSLIKKLQYDYSLTVLLISHDQKSVRKYADRILEMRIEGVTS